MKTMHSTIRWLVWHTQPGEVPVRKGVVVGPDRHRALADARAQHGPDVWVQSEASFEAGGQRDLRDRFRRHDQFWLHFKIPGH